MHYDEHPNWVEVTKAEFYLRLGSTNATGRITNDRWPYTTLYESPAGYLIGKIVGYLVEGSALEQTKYYIAMKG